MSSLHNRRGSTRIVGALSVVAVISMTGLSALPGAASASASSAGASSASTGTSGKHALAHRLSASTRLDKPLLSASDAAAGVPKHGPVTVMLELDTASPTTLLAQRGLRAGSAAGIAQTRVARARVEAQAQSVKHYLTQPRTAATPLYTVHNVYAGVAVRTDASRMAALADLPGVKAVHLMSAKRLLNSSTVPLINAPAAWTAPGADTGTGVTIGIIDTGIDYTHADFGGTGTAAAYKADQAVDDKPTLTVPSGDFPSAKVVGGRDFVGDAYDPDAIDGSEIPHADPNPLDCDGHGTHVAGTAAGLGVTAAGHPYAGPWDSTTPFASLKIGPGVAPGAKLYALRVFGCTGSTDAVTEALDWAADPNGDGIFTDHLDVVNMSLGEDFTVPDDPDSVAADNLSLLGTTVVAAAGNGGDLQYIAGSPSNANRAISVASSQDALTVYDALHVDAPAAVVGDVVGQEGDAFDWAGSSPVSGPVASLDPTFDPADPSALDPATLETTNADGCDPFTSAQQAKVNGKIAWLEWTDSDSLRRCGSAARATNAAVAGAIGVVLTDDENNFGGGIVGASTIPTFQIRKTDAATLRPYLNSTLALTLTHALHNSQKVSDSTLTDVVSDFSSRGLTDPGNLKPDVTAPGSTVFSAGIGTGSEGLSDSGTSMATPHVAGAAALVKAAHHAWTPEQIKAALVDTAVHDVWSSPAHTSREAPDRVGSGRIDAGAAAKTQVLAYNLSNPGSVSLSFGAQSYAADTTLSKTVKLSNDGDADATYVLSFDWANSGTHPAGVTYAFPPTVTIPAGGSVQVPVTMTIHVKALTRTLDAAHDVDVGGITSNYLTEASGWLTMTPSAGGQTLRLSVFSAPRPASTVKAAGSMVFGRNTTAKVALTGTGIRQSANAYQSTVSGYELQLTSPKKPACTSPTQDALKCVLIPSDRAGDLRYVGVSSDAPLYADPTSGLTYFAVSTWGPWRTPVSYAEYDIFIDTNGDGKADAVLINDRITGTDVFVSALLNPNTGDVIDDSIFPINYADGSVDSNPFNNDVMVLPVATGALTSMSKKAASGNISYWVAVGTASSGMTDTSPGKASFNVLKPGLGIIHGPALTGLAGQNYGGEQFFAGLATSSTVPGLTVLRESTYAAQHGQGLLLLHPENLPGQRVQVVPITKVASSVTVTAKAAHSPVKVGTWVTITATVKSARTGIGAPVGTVTLYDNGKPLITRAVDAHGQVRLATNKLKKGVHVIGARYSGNADWTTNKATLKIVVH